MSGGVPGEYRSGLFQSPVFFYCLGESRSFVKSRVEPAIRRQIAAWLRPGRIVLLNFPEAGKPKYFVVGALKPDLTLLVVNTVAYTQGGNPTCAACQVGLTNKDYPCFTHIESYLNCYQLVETITFEDAVEQLAAKPKWMNGMPMINSATAQKIVDAVKSSDDIDEMNATEIVANLTKLLPS
jgi:hypothetical protein